MTIQDLINRLQQVENKDRDISIVLGNEDNNSLVFDEFELHNEHDTDTSIEIFCFDEYMFEQDYCYSVRDIFNN